MAAKATIITAMKVMKEEKQENLLEKIARKDKMGRNWIKGVDKETLNKMSIWKRRSWSTRARRWLRKMPQELLDRDPWTATTRARVKEWVKENVPRNGDDPIMWGQWSRDEMDEARTTEESCPRPKWSGVVGPPKKKRRTDVACKNLEEEMDKNHHCKDEEDGKDCMQEQEREGGQSAEDRVEAKRLRLVRNREKSEKEEKKGGEAPEGGSQEENNGGKG